MSSSQPPSGKRNPLGFDELIAILVAFGTMGAIFFWVTGKNPNQFGVKNWQFPAVFSESAPAPANTGILMPAAPSSDLPAPVPAKVPAPATTLIPPPRNAPGVGALGPILPQNPPVGAIVVVPETPVAREVVPQTPVARETPPPAITKPKGPKPKVGAVKFSDVSDKYWALPFIVALVDRQIFTDFTDNKFRPDEPMTRAELARLIERMSDKKETRKPINFEDVKDKNPVASAIDGSVQKGFLKGYPNNEFRPTKDVPRVEVIVALASGLNLKKEGNSSKILQVYTDRQKVPKWAVDKVAAATKAGIVVNHPEPKLLQPNKTATRAEVAAMIYQAMVKKGKVPAKPSKYVIKQAKSSR
ncbi:S-layer homology domain-containing protein [Tychonema sp. LEGE 07203]|uniref:S-layer homology domain-containing protein n=1 Tax=Tychonema sp. LEGE 07203 TaxID=1828671 RepID=UPI00187F7601|nr:S-layer homology domain-containing protein [Tychonema sp. LEGE 07203]MBE9097264.1 S-layer homology domain-containing protein [Tychonema sp. LEGE 07203]